jgi:hypothetical protein
MPQEREFHRTPLTLDTGFQKVNTVSADLKKVSIKAVRRRESSSRARPSAASLDATRTRVGLHIAQQDFDILNVPMLP